MTGKKVLVVTTTDNMIWQFIIPHIQHLQQMGNTVECACAETGFWFNELKEKYGFTMHKIDFPRNPLNKRIFSSRKQFFNLVKENKYDLIYCHQPVGGVMGRMAGKKFGVPVIYIAHGFHFFKGCPKINLMYKVIEKHYSKYTDALVTMNQEDYDSALKFKAKKVYKINGIGLDLGKYKKSEDTSAIKSELKLNDDDFVVLSIGELNENKNHMVVLQAIAQLNNAKIKYIICGQGKRLEEYQNLVKQLGIEENVKFLGFRKDIPEILSVANVFVMPSLREGLPKSMMEAMGIGMPVVGSDIRGCKDLIDAEGGLLCNPTSVEDFAVAIKTLSEDAELCKSMAKHNLEKIKDYSIEKVKEQLAEVYEEAIR